MLDALPSIGVGFRESLQIGSFLCAEAGEIQQAAALSDRLEGRPLLGHDAISCCWLQ